ncbi:MAG TPA: DUF202 domain-containing protein [Gemmatimonadaceae bacterium]|nr:DUF202 domain-containing protein [Gemmatimonadaceae bacterium]
MSPTIPDGPDASAAPTAPDARRPGERQEQLAYDRTFLANERTYAAWLRTGLAIAGGGIVVARLIDDAATPSALAMVLGAAFVSCGIGVMTYGAREFTRTIARLSRDAGRAAPLSPRVPWLLTGIITVLLAAVLALMWRA